MLDRAVNEFSSADTEMGTMALVMDDGSKLTDPNSVKVVVDNRGRALYFSRAAIPFDWPDTLERGYYKHLGIYIYRREFLLRFSDLPHGKLEARERLEQLRALENGYRIKVVVVEGKTQSVDVPEDVAKVERLLQGE